MNVLITHYRHTVESVTKDFQAEENPHIELSAITNNKNKCFALYDVSAEKQDDSFQLCLLMCAVLKKHGFCSILSLFFLGVYHFHGERKKYKKIKLLHEM